MTHPTMTAADIICTHILDQQLNRVTQQTAHVWLQGHQSQASSLLAVICQQARNSGAISLWSTGNNHLKHPWNVIAQLVIELVLRLETTQPELITRYGAVILTLAPQLKDLSALQGKTGYRALLADFVLQNNSDALIQFYRKREIKPRIQTQLVKFIFDAATAVAHETGLPLFICIEDFSQVDSLSKQVLDLLVHLSETVPLHLWVCSQALPDTANAASWQLLYSHVHSTYNNDTTSVDHSILALFNFIYSPLPVHTINNLLGYDATAEVQTLCQTGWLREDKRGLCIAHQGITNKIKELLMTTVNNKQQAFYATLLEQQKNEPTGCEAFYYASQLTHFLSVTKDFKQANNDNQQSLNNLQLLKAQAAMRALCYSWNLADYPTARYYVDCALALFNENKLSDQQNRLLLQGLLAYEADDHQEAHQSLEKVLAVEKDALAQTRWQHLLGHNAIFGSGDYPLGLDYLQAALNGYETKGEANHAIYVRNSMAFGLFRSRSVNDVINYEKEVLQLARSTTRSDLFIDSILQLNLARVHTVNNELQSALNYLQNAIAGDNGDLSPLLRMVFHAKLGHLNFALKQYPQAVTAFWHCLELARCQSLEGTTERLLPSLGELFKRSVDSLNTQLILRDRLALAYIHFNLGLACKQAGLQPIAEACQRQVVHLLQPINSKLNDQINRVFAESTKVAGTTHTMHAIAPPLQSKPTDIAAQLQQSPMTEAIHYQQLSNGIINKAVDLLLNKQAIAWVRQKTATQAMDTLVLFDAQAPLCLEVLNNSLTSQPHKQGCLVIAPGDHWFSEPVEPLPWVLQERTLLSEHRAKLPGLQPISMLVQALNPDWDTELWELAQAYYQRSGYPLLGVASFSLAAHDLVTQTDSIIGQFLESNLTSLVYSDYWINKRFSNDAAENLLLLRPRTFQSVHIQLVENSHNQRICLIHSNANAGSKKQLSVAAALAPIFPLCDGAHTIVAIATAMKSQIPELTANKLCYFFRTLQQQQVIYFVHTTQPLQNKPAYEPTL
ncbi:hypothetical protein [Spartinivicinus poritis]|uniref:CHAT domain-containing protein n=1 Tax=Spartinivicinus poritis TaxID=2994640 RepID=A0ABT5UFT8_9GAMM|nr:hypothetical protein [Spartinivicinus sp. A2-2]MDE1464851.1 hypothetical protein [Spartinivicinus sp. A2-2]